VLMAAVIVSSLIISSDVSGQVQERSRLLLPDIAKVTLDASGQSQIAFNPAICRRLGPDLCEYFRAHEYGHVNLRHLERGVPVRQAEHEADVWAARNASPSAVAAAHRYFSQGNGGSRIHGSSQVRAGRIAAVQAGRSTASTTVKTSSVTRRVPTQYAGGSTKSIVRIPSSCRTQSVRRVVYVNRSPSSTTQAFVPQGGFNNPR